MSPSLSSAARTKERDVLWEAVLASPLVVEDLSAEEEAALEEGMADIRSGRVVSREVTQATIERLRRDQGE